MAIRIEVTAVVFHKPGKILRQILSTSLWLEFLQDNLSLFVFIARLHT